MPFRLILRRRHAAYYAMRADDDAMLLLTRCAPWRHAIRYAAAVMPYARYAAIMLLCYYATRHCCSALLMISLR